MLLDHIMVEHSKERIFQWNIRSLWMKALFRESRIRTIDPLERSWLKIAPNQQIKSRLYYCLDTIVL
jgi:hypothetical protein